MKNDVPVCAPKFSENVKDISCAEKEKTSIVRDYLLDRKNEAQKLIDTMSADWENDQYLCNLLASVTMIDKTIDSLDCNKISYPEIKRLEALAHVEFISNIFN